MIKKIINRGIIYLDNFKIYVAVWNKIFCQNTHARANFQNINAGILIKKLINDFLGNGFIIKEMLTKIFLWFNGIFQRILKLIILIFGSKFFGFKSRIKDKAAKFILGKQPLIIIYHLNNREVTVLVKIQFNFFGKAIRNLDSLPLFHVIISTQKFII